MVGAVQNFTLRLGPYDVGGLLAAFTKLRDRVLANIDRVQEKQELREKQELGEERGKLQTSLVRQCSLEELRSMLHGAFAFKYANRDERNKVMKDLDALTENMTDDEKKHYYAAAILREGAIQGIGHVWR